MIEFRAVEKSAARAKSMRVIRGAICQPQYGSLYEPLRTVGSPKCLIRTSFTAILDFRGSRLVQGCAARKSGLGSVAYCSLCGLMT
jgi:hypothetical protein